jgi:cyclohexanone monooxygenase
VIKSEQLPFDPSALMARYDEEREKRLAANPEGVDQYRSIKDNDPTFGHYLHDPYITEKIERDPINDETEVLIVGGGYGSQLVAARLVEQGITDIRIVEKGGNFGGTWYWCVSS